MNKVIEQNLNQSNKIMFYVIPLLLLMSFGLTFFNNTLTEFLFIGLPAALIPMFLIKYNPLNKFTRYSVAASFMIFAALQIHQMHGMIEMHFGIFVLLAFLIVYKDVITNLIGAAIIAVHHLSFYYLQSSGNEIYVVSPENLSFPLILIHAGFVIAETIILCIIASSAYKDMKINADLQGAIDKTIKESGNICLNNLCELEDVEITSKYNILIKRLQNTISKITNTTDNLIVNSNTITESNGEMQINFENNKQDIQNIVNQTEEITEGVVTMEESTQNINEIVSETVVEIGKGIETINDNQKEVNLLAESLNFSNEKINELSKSCEDITQVLSVIQNITEQTNLLALNAAIEAARAGEAGRGFAVVSDEVRSLANRTQESTQEISTIIEALTKNSEESVESMNTCLSRLEKSKETANESKLSFDKTSNEINKVSDIINEIAYITSQQKDKTLIVNESVANINENITNQSSLIEQTATSTEELSIVSKELGTEIEVFEK